MIIKFYLVNGNSKRRVLELSKMLPLIVDVENRKIVIFGGGAVGERKAELFKDADTYVVSRDFAPAIQKLAEDGFIKLVKSDLNDIESIIKDAFLVIPATDDLTLNSRILKMAKKHNILVNQVNAVGDVLIPSVIKKGDIVIGISTQGKSPAISKFIRKRFEQIVTQKYADMVRLQDEIRELLKERVPSQKLREKVLWEILNDGVIWEALESSYDKAYALSIAHMDSYSKKSNGAQ